MDKIPFPPCMEAATNQYDWYIAICVCSAIVILAILALIGLLVYHHQTLKNNLEQEQKKHEHEEAEAKNKTIAELRAKKLESLKENADKYIAAIEEYLNA